VRVLVRARRTGCPYLGLLALLEESLLAGLLLGLLRREVLGRGDLVDLLGIYSRQVDLL
jgi:hypothetical protein